MPGANNLSYGIGPRRACEDTRVCFGTVKLVEWKAHSAVVRFARQVAKELNLPHGRANSQPRSSVHDWTNHRRCPTLAVGSQFATALECRTREVPNRNIHKAR